MHLPLRLRLTAIFALAMAVLLVGLGAFVLTRFQADLVASVDMGLRSRAQVLASAVGTAEQEAAVVARGLLIDPDEAFAQVLDESGQIVDASPAVEDAPLVTPGDVQAGPEPTFLTRDVVGFDDPVRLLAVRIGASASSGFIVIGATLGDVNDATSQLFTGLATVSPAALLVTAWAGWLLAGAALRPVEQMRREAAAISASEPARRLPVPTTGDELSRLATTLNVMLDRLQEALERERRFVDDASHELRTPLATLRAEIDLALARQRTAPDLEAALRSAQEDVLHIQRLADDLLVLARSGGGRVPVRLTPIALSDLVDRGVRSVRVQAQVAGATIRVDATDEIVSVDPDRVEQALRNLLENALRNSPPGGIVHVDARRADRMARIVVDDTGPGFPPGLLATAFDPFTTGAGPAERPNGVGLGLAIVRAVAEAHGGTVTAENTAAGARVTLTLRAGDPERPP